MNNILKNYFYSSNGTVPFSKFHNNDFSEAIQYGIDLAEQEIEQIVVNPESPTFTNTILALENSGEVLERVLSIFYPLLSANADDELMQIAQHFAPKLTEHHNRIMQNEQLWSKVRSVYEQCDKLNLDAEERMLLEKTHRSFVRNGVGLPDMQKREFRQLSSSLSQLTLKFEQNLMKERAEFKLWLNEEQLKGLPNRVIEMLKQTAKEAGNPTKYLVTLSPPIYTEVMKYAVDRQIRETLYRAYNSVCTKGEYSNLDNVVQIANTRLKIANLLGYKTFAEYKTSNVMAKSAHNVMRLLHQLLQAYHEPMQDELKQLNSYAQEQGLVGDLMPWDYAYYYNKLREEFFQYNEEEFRPYFSLDFVTKGILGLATKLYGITFIPLSGEDLFHEDVQIYQVCDGKGDLIATLYLDFFPRPSKQNGAWMTNFREQKGYDTTNSETPIVTLTMNFTKPSQDEPSLLSLQEVNTFLHEFGHGLHSILSQCKYRSLSGTNVDRDFVELPSQLMENFLLQPEFLRSFARHHKTGESIPQNLIDRALSVRQFGCAYACIRQLNFGYLDMAWHSIQEPVNITVAQFEENATKQTKVFQPVEGCLISPQFAHIFAGGYAAGYYGYKWAEVLDADAFELFEEQGIFSHEVSHKFRAEILSKGGTVNSQQAYEKFRGRSAKIDALLRRDGIIK